MRLGFTIVFNGLHHLLHNGFAYRMADLLDVWCVVEGPAGHEGSTSWCRSIPNRYVNFAGSVDGTIAFLQTLSHTAPNDFKLIRNGFKQWRQYWASKDAMVNAATKELRRYMQERGAGEGFLWQVDVDEQWTKEQMDAAERELIDKGGDCGCFHCDYWVGPHLRAEGTWGEGNDPKDALRNAYRRLWKWDGRKFASHEPPKLEGGNGKEVLLTPRFQHYAYYYEQDVRFKEAYYSGHDGVLDRWRRLQSRPAEDFPLPISELITGRWGQTETKIVRVA